MKRPVDSLTAKDFAKFPVWRFTNDDSPDETYVSPVRRLPVEKCAGCVIGCSVRLANGTTWPSVLANFNPDDSRLVEHFLCLSIFRDDGATFHLARYHDVDAARRGPAALAAFLDLPIEDIFPIAYDVSTIVKGPLNALRGTIPVQPRERLTHQEIISLAVASTRQALR